MTPAHEITNIASSDAFEHVDRSKQTTGSQTSFPLLVAIAADECTTPTVHFAEALMAQRGVAPSLLYVMELTPVATMEGGIGAAVLTQTLLDPVGHAEDERSLRATCHVDTGVPATWPFTLEIGDAASSIVAHAQKIKAQLIVMGLHRHGVVDHILHEDTVRNVIGTGNIPVLAMRPELVTLPKSIVVATDFSVASLRAARLARELLADKGTIHMVFVEPLAADIVDEREQGHRLIDTNGVDMAFNQVRAMLDPTPGVEINLVKRFGNPIDELKAVCESVQPELLAIGSQRHPFFKQLFLGTVTKAMLADGRWSILVTPPAPQ